MAEFLDVVVSTVSWLFSAQFSIEIKIGILYIGWVITEMFPVKIDSNFHRILKHNLHDEN